MLITELSAGGPASAILTEAERALIDYADILTTRPAEVGPQDVNRLRAVGLDDRAIHDACLVISYFAFVNRMADGLGVELETDPDPG